MEDQKKCLLLNETTLQKKLQMMIAHSGEPLCVQQWSIVGWEGSMVSSKKQGNERVAQSWNVTKVLVLVYLPQNIFSGLN